MRLAGATAVLVLAALGGRAFADETPITWEKDLPAAQATAHGQGKLVLDFLLIGRLDCPDC